MPIYSSNLHKLSESDASIQSINKPESHHATGKPQVTEHVQDETKPQTIKPKADASISLAYQKEDGATRLISRSHFGQLHVQKPFYPEGKEVCHVVLVHPPGGVVGGDRLEITNHVGAEADVKLARSRYPSDIVSAQILSS